MMHMHTMRTYHNTCWGVMKAMNAQYVTRHTPFVTMIEEHWKVKGNATTLFVMSVFHNIRTIMDLVLSNVQIAGLKLMTLYVMKHGPPHLRQLRWLWMTNQHFAIGLWVLCQILALTTNTKKGVYVTHIIYN